MKSISTLPSVSAESTAMFPIEPFSFVGTVAERRLADVFGWLPASAADNITDDMLGYSRARSESDPA